MVKFIAISLLLSSGLIHGLINLSQAGVPEADKPRCPAEFQLRTVDQRLLCIRDEIRVFRAVIPCNTPAGKQTRLMIDARQKQDLCAAKPPSSPVCAADYQIKIRTGLDACYRIIPGSAIQPEFDPKDEKPTVLKPSILLPEN